MASGLVWVPLVGEQLVIPKRARLNVLTVGLAELHTKFCLHQQFALHYPYLQPNRSESPLNLLTFSGT